MSVIAQFDHLKATEIGGGICVYAKAPRGDWKLLFFGMWNDENFRAHFKEMTAVMDEIAARLADLEYDHRHDISVSPAVEALGDLGGGHGG